MALVKKFLPLLVALIVVVYLFLIDNPSSRLFEKPSDKGAQSAPAFFMTDFVSRHFDDKGKLSQLLRGKRADHYQPKGKAGPGDYTLVTELTAEIYNDIDAPWLITADQGRATHKGERLELRGNVHMRQVHPTRGVTELFTDTLIYFTKRQFAETEAPVKIFTPNGLTTAEGLTADIKTELFTLKNHVKGTYAPD
jgi:lipopolysaccharide export system protein LptC